MPRLIRPGKSLFYRFPMLLSLAVGFFTVIAAFVIDRVQTSQIRKGHAAIVRDSTAFVKLLVLREPGTPPDPAVITAMPPDVSRVISRISWQPAAGGQGWTQTLSTPSGRYGSIGLPLADGNGKPGTLEVVFTDVLPESLIRQIRLFLGIYMGLFLLLTLGTAYLLLLRQVRRPLKILMMATESIARGEFTKRLQFPVRDEFALLGADVTAMSHRLKRSFAEIAAKNKEIERCSLHLEEMVQERTKALDGAHLSLQYKQLQYERELEMARRIQLGIIPLPAQRIVHTRLEVATHYEAMQSVGGDLLDIIRAGRNKYAFLIADVSGHGVPSAMITSMAKVSFMTAVNWNSMPDEVCARVNREMVRLIGDQGYFISAFLGILDMETGSFCFSNAGHHPVLLLRDGLPAKPLDTVGRLLGVWSDSRFGQAVEQLFPGDRLLFFTDGIIEARNPDGELYGMERLLECCRTGPGDIGDLLGSLVTDVDKFCEGRDVDDDRAVLGVAFFGTESLDRY